MQTSLFGLGIISRFNRAWIYKDLKVWNFQQMSDFVLFNRSINTGTHVSVSSRSTWKAILEWKTSLVEFHRLIFYITVYWVCVSIPFIRSNKTAQQSKLFEKIFVLHVVIFFLNLNSKYSNLETMVYSKVGWKLSLPQMSSCLESRTRFQCNLIEHRCDTA